jgi:D-arabinose 1-dehydrogenase-like Zn-dependent alcohol dehydrogenase
MKSSRFAEFGPSSVLRIEEVPIPEPAEGEALVRAKAAAMNPSDIADVSGRFKNTTLPRTPGRGSAGLVVKGKQYEGEEPEGVRCERCGKQESQYSHSRQSQVPGTAAFTPELLNFLKNTAMMGGLLFIAATESQPTLLPRTARSNVREWTRNEGPTPSSARAS